MYVHCANLLQTSKLRRGCSEKQRRTWINCIKGLWKRQGISLVAFNYKRKSVQTIILRVWKLFNCTYVIYLQVNYCEVSFDLPELNAFVFVARTKHESFKVTNDSVTITSEVDDKVKLVIPKGTFEDATQLFLEVSFQHPIIWLPKNLLRCLHFFFALVFRIFYMF